jgi:hypothetical protein
LGGGLNFKGSKEWKLKEVKVTIMEANGGEELSYLQHKECNFRGKAFKMKLFFIKSFYIFVYSVTMHL